MQVNIPMDDFKVVQVFDGEQYLQHPSRDEIF
jgi:hypothetical protein